MVPGSAAHGALHLFGVLAAVLGDAVEELLHGQHVTASVPARLVQVGLRHRLQRAQHRRVVALDLGQQPPEMLSPISREIRTSNRRDSYLIARVEASVDVTMLTERLRAASSNLPQAAPPPGHGPADLMQRIPFDEVRLVPIGDHLGRRQRPALALVISAAGILLLLACVNLAGLTAARNIERYRTWLFLRCWRMALRACSSSPS